PSPATTAPIGWLGRSKMDPSLSACTEGTRRSGNSWKAVSKVVPSSACGKPDITSNRSKAPAQIIFRQNSFVLRQDLTRKTNPTIVTNGKTSAVNRLNATKCTHRTKPIAAIYRESDHAAPRPVLAHNGTISNGKALSVASSGAS